MAERIFVGHFLTRGEAALRARISPKELRQRPDLLRVGGTHLPEVYFAFQFDGRGIRRDLGAVVLALRRRHDDETIADWLARPNEQLALVTPLRWAATHGDPAQLLIAAERAGPEVEVSPEAVSYAPVAPGRTHRRYRRRSVYTRGSRPTAAGVGAV